MTAADTIEALRQAEAIYALARDIPTDADIRIAACGRAMALVRTVRVALEAEERARNAYHDELQAVKRERDPGVVVQDERRNP